MKDGPNDYLVIPRNHTSEALTEGYIDFMIPGPSDYSDQLLAEYGSQQAVFKDKLNRVITQYTDLSEKEEVVNTLLNVPYPLTIHFYGTLRS